jgi:hypothetical protein
MSVTSRALKEIKGIKQKTHSLASHRLTSRQRRSAAVGVLLTISQTFHYRDAGYTQIK